MTASVQPAGGAAGRETPAPARLSRGPWFVLALAFALLAAAWTTLIIIARRHPMESVPLEHRAEKG